MCVCLTAARADVGIKAHVCVCVCVSVRVSSEWRPRTQMNRLVRERAARDASMIVCWRAEGEGEA